MGDTINKAAEERVARRYKDSIDRLEESIRKARQYNDKLSQQLFVLNNRVSNVAHKIGYPTFDDFEEGVLDDPEMWNLETIKSNHLLAARLDDNCEKSREKTQGHTLPDSSTYEGLKEGFEKLKRQVHDLQQSSIKKAFHMPAVDSTDPVLSTRSPLAPLKSVGNSTPQEESKLRAELSILSHKYDALVSAKKSAEAKYKEDYRKWKMFKSWLLNKSKHAKAVRAQLAEGNFDFAEDFEGAANETPHGPTTKSRRPSPSSSLSRNDENDFSLTTPSKPTNATPSDIGSSGRPVVSNSKGTRSRNRSTTGSISRSASPSPTAKTRNEPLLGLTKAPSCGDVVKNEISLPLEGPSASSEGKGRYSNSARTGEAINEIFAIDASRNNGLAFQYDEVVRNKEHRKRLEAGDCDCCREYYDAVEPVPSRMEPPAWLSPPSKGAVLDTHPEYSNLQQEKSSSHKKQISRHRHQWSPAKTPPDYWNIGFPTTQEAAEINKRAAEMHEDKRRRIEKEANMAGGRYIKRGRK